MKTYKRRLNADQRWELKWRKQALTGLRIFGGGYLLGIAFCMVLAVAIVGGFSDFGGRNPWLILLLFAGAIALFVVLRFYISPSITKLKVQIEELMFGRYYGTAGTSMPAFLHRLESRNFVSISVKHGPYVAVRIERRMKNLADSPIFMMYKRYPASSQPPLGIHGRLGDFHGAMTRRNQKEWRGKNPQAWQKIAFYIRRLARQHGSLT